MTLTSSQWIVVGISTIVSLWLLRYVWLGRDPIFFKVLLALVGLIPLIGPLVLLWNSVWPNKWPEGMRAEYPKQVNHYTYSKVIDSNLDDKQKSKR